MRNTTVNSRNFNAALAALAVHASNVADERSDAGRAHKAALVRHAATMSDKAKIAADLEVIAFLSGKYGVKSHVATQGSVFSGRVFEKDTAVNQGLKRARWILSTTPENVEERAAKFERTAHSIDKVAKAKKLRAQLKALLSTMTAGQLARYRAA